MDIRRFLVELRGRKIYRVAAIYAAGSWALLQISDILFPIVGFPEWAVPVVLVATALGFPVAIALAWVFDITPQGIVETDVSTWDASRYKLSPGRLVEFVLILALVILVGYLYVDRLRRDRLETTETTRVERKSIAVMAFANMTEDSEMAYFGDGLAEQILNLLARINELDVTARTSSFYFKNRDADIREIANRLGVGHVLEGSVRRHGNQIRVTAQLIDASSGFHLWSDTYDRDFEDSFSIQDEIARQVVEALQLLLSNSSRKILNLRPMLDPVAYDYYLRARDYMRRTQNIQNLDQAITLFNKAVELDENYAEAYAGLCDAHLGHYRLELDSVQFKKAESACQTTLELDSNVVPVYVALGNLYRYTGKYEQANAEYDKALAINRMAVDALDGLAETYLLDNKPNLAEKTYLLAIQTQPNYPRGYMSMGSFLFKVGRFEEALPYYRRVTELMPDNAQAFNNLSAGYYMLNRFEPANEALQQSLAISPTPLGYSNAGSSLFLLGRFDEAANMYKKALDYAPEDHQHWGNLGDAYLYSATSQHLAQSTYRKAIALAAGRLRVNPSDAITLGLVAHYHARIGNREQALQNIARAEALAPENVYVNYNRATTLCALGETPQALAALEKAIELGYSVALALGDASLCDLSKLLQFREQTRIP